MPDSSSSSGIAAPDAAAIAPLKEPVRPAPVIFDEDWWLDAPAPGAWDRVRVLWDGELAGEMAFHVQRR